MRYLFATLLTQESDFYGRVGAELERSGHQVAFVSESRHATLRLRERRFEAFCLPELVRELPEVRLSDEVKRIEERYRLPSIRAIYGTDPACTGKPEEWCLRFATGRFRALEALFDELQPDVVVPEVGAETIRMAAHRIGLDRSIPVLFLFYTIFPRPLRLYVDTMHAPIVPKEELRPLTPAEEAELEEFRQRFTARAEPIRRHRHVSLHPRRLVSFGEFVTRKLRFERDNEYFRPLDLLRKEASGFLRSHSARLLYERRDPDRRFVYFPLHVTDDYKIKTLIPHCRDQAALVELIADSLPPGYDLVVKEHPMSVGRNPLGWLRRLRRRQNVKLVHPRVSSHVLMREADAVAVISSTVGLEALLYEKPVLTLGDPFYAGFGVTLDAASFAEIPEAVPAVLRFRPDPELVRRFLHAAMRRCYAGAPILVDDSDENARALARTLDEVGTRIVEERAAQSGSEAKPLDVMRPLA